MSSKYYLEEKKLAYRWSLVSDSEIGIWKCVCIEPNVARELLRDGSVDGQKGAGPKVQKFHVLFPPDRIDPTPSQQVGNL